MFITVADSLVLSRDAERAATFHGVPCINGQIQDRHLNLIGIDDGRRQSIGQVHDHLNLRTRSAGDEVGHPGDERAKVNWLRLKGLTPSKSEQPLNKSLRTLGGLQRAVDKAALSIATQTFPLQKVE